MESSTKNMTENIHKYAVELVGTFILAFIVALLVVQGAPAAPFITVIVFGVLVYLLGGLSGAHLNPALTLGALTIHKINVRDAVMYIIAQFLGAALALYALNAFFPGFIEAVDPLRLNVSNTPVVAIAEGLGMFVLSFGFAAFLYGKLEKSAEGLVVAGAYLVGILLASVASSALLNPAIGMVVGSFNTMYIVGPLVGGIAGMHAYKYLNGLK